jgi:VWFA-related protein
MTRAATAILLAVLLQSAPAPSRMLTIDFVALDRAGIPVPDLKPGDVEVWIGQFRAPIQRMTVVTPEADERPGRFLVLLLDDMTLRLDSMPRAREAARMFVTRMGANDHVAVLTMMGPNTNMETTTDRAKLLRAIDAYSPRATPVMRSDTLGRHVLDTLGSISASFVETTGRRKTIVAIGSGWLFDRPLPPPIAGQDLLPEWVRAMKQMALSHVNLYVIDPSGVGTARVDGGQEGFARETGGHAFFNTNDLSGAVDRILRESASFYMVDVPDPPVGGKTDLRPLELKSLRKGVTLRARHAIPGSF